jgi:hypothetical protein
MGSTKKTAQFSISEDNYWRLKELASREKKSLSFFLRDAVQAYAKTLGVEIDLAADMESWGGNRHEKDE